MSSSATGVVITSAGIMPALFTLIGPRIWWPALRASPKNPAYVQ